MKGLLENQDRGAPAGGETFPVTGCAAGGWGTGVLAVSRGQKKGWVLTMPGQRVQNPVITESV